MSDSVPDLVVLSDLHLGEGLRDPRRYSPMEDFFYDGEFARLLARLRRDYADPASLVLVLNGDIFDFLSVTRTPDRAEAGRRGFRVSGAERRFGLNPTPSKSLYKMELIISGHPRFFAALARFVGAGYRVEILRGNHDLELHFEVVRDKLLEYLTEVDGGPTLSQARERVGYHEWYYLEEGRVYVEHGNQYESSNSIRYPLRPVLPRRRSRREREPVLDYPLGSYFVRYFYNAIHAINPHTPKVVSFEQYLEFLRRHNLLDLLRVARRHWPFFARAVTTGTPGGSARGSPEVAAEHEEVLQALEDQSEQHDFHRQLDRLKIHPAVASKAALAKQLAEPVVRRVAWVGSLSLVTLYVWLLVFNLIQATPWLAENVFAKAVLLVLFALLTGVGLVGAANVFARRMRHASDEVAEMCADRAEKIAHLTGVDLVLMGHTHIVDVRPLLSGAATYANSGTWTSVDNPWDRLHPGARRFTFLRVRGKQVEVVRWNDDADRIDPVPMFDLPANREMGSLHELPPRRVPPAPKSTA